MICHVVLELWEMQEGMALFTVHLSVMFLGDFLPSNKFFKFLDLFPCSGAGIGSPVSTDGKDDALMADS